MDTDTNYETDRAQRTTLGVLTSNNDYWLASRYQEYVGYGKTYIRYFNHTKNDVDNCYLSQVTDTGFNIHLYGYVQTKALRPVITLRLDTKIVDGQGTAESPYVLGR